MKNSEIVQQWSDAFNNGDEKQLDVLIAEDFLLTGPGPEPLNKSAYLTLAKALFNANTNFNNNAIITSALGNVVKGSTQLEGTHTKNLDLSLVGLGILPPTNIHWKNPIEKFTVMINNGKVIKCDYDIPEGGGIVGLLKQLGVNIPE